MCTTVKKNIVQTPAIVLILGSFFVPTLNGSSKNGNFSGTKKNSCALSLTAVHF